MVSCCSVEVGGVVTAMRWVEMGCAKPRCRFRVRVRVVVRVRVILHNVITYKCYRKLYLGQEIPRSGDEPPPP